MIQLSRFALAALLATSFAFTSKAAEVNPLLPAESESVVYFNVRQILDSDLIKKFALGQLKQALEGDDAKKMTESLDLDPLKDIDSVVAGVWGKEPEMNGVFVVKGRFNATKMFEAAQKAAKNEGDKIAIVTEGKLKLVKFTPENDGDPIFLSVADKETIVGGSSVKLVASALKVAESNGKPMLKGDLAKLVIAQDAKASMFLCGLVDGKIPQLPPAAGQIPNVDPQELQKQLEAMKNIAITLRVTGDVEMEVDAGMKSADDASAFGKTVSGLLDTAKAFLPLAMGQQPQFKSIGDDLVDTLKSSSEKDNVSLSFKISGDSIAKAANQDN